MLTAIKSNKIVQGINVLITLLLWAWLPILYFKTQDYYDSCYDIPGETFGREGCYLFPWAFVERPMSPGRMMTLTALHPLIQQSLAVYIVISLVIFFFAPKRWKNLIFHLGPLVILLLIALSTEFIKQPFFYG